MDPKEWFPKWATRGDLAAAAVGYAVGFAVDVFYFPDGVPPGTTAGVFAVATAGLKNTAQTVLEELKEKRRKQWDRLALEERVSVLRETLTAEELEAPAEKLARDLRLWRKGILEDDDLRQILAEVIRDYRKSRLGAEAASSARPGHLERQGDHSHEAG